MPLALIATAISDSTAVSDTFRYLFSPGALVALQFVRVEASHRGLGIFLDAIGAYAKIMIPDASLRGCSRKSSFWCGEPFHIKSVVHRLSSQHEVGLIPQLFDLYRTQEWWMSHAGSLWEAARYQHLSPAFLADAVALLDAAFDIPRHRGVTGPRELTEAVVATA